MKLSIAGGIGTAAIRRMRRRAQRVKLAIATRRLTLADISTGMLRGMLDVLAVTGFAVVQPQIVAICAELSRRECEEDEALAFESAAHGVAA